MTDFSMLGLDPRLMAALGRMGFDVPTPIQARAIPHAMNGRDVLGLAQTGTGKTAAFGLPLLHGLLSGPRPAPRAARALVLAPTRELVSQIAATLGDLSRDTGLRIQVVVGGASANAQAQRLARGADVLVATPGRLIDLMERGAVSLGNTRQLVLDEADQMLDLGFIHALRRIARALPEDRRTMLFSATMPKQMDELAATYLVSPARVQAARPGQVAERIDQAVHFVNQGDKARLLESCLAHHREDAALVFARTKHGAEKLMKLLVSWGFAAGSIHGNKSQGQRERALRGFREGGLMVLVATDVAARGLDIPQVRHVYNYDLPNVPENYVHRIGRTARAGAAGRALAFCAPAEAGELRAIEKLLGHPLPVAGGTRPAETLAARPQGVQPGARRRGGAPGPARKRGGGGRRKPTASAAA